MVMRRKTLALGFLALVIIIACMLFVASKGASQAPDLKDPGPVLKTGGPDEELDPSELGDEFVGIVPVIPGGIGALVPMATGLAAFGLMAYRSRKH